MKAYYTCYIEGRGDRWEAACIDFDLSVSGRSLEEVKSLLETAVRSYVVDAISEAEPARTQLLKRKAPLMVRLRWRLRVFGSQIGIGEGAPSFEGRYALPCPA